MKIQGPRNTSNTSSSKKAGKTEQSGDASFDAFIGSTGGAKESASTSAPKSVAQVSALLAAQAVEDPTERAAKKRMALRADDVLKGLDDLQSSMMHGSVTAGNMIDLADKVSAQKEKVSDPKLSALLDEIDLRAQVELAKMRKALDNS